MNEQNNLNPNSQQGVSNGVTPNNLNQNTQPMGQNVQVVPQAQPGIEPLPVPNVVQQPVTQQAAPVTQPVQPVQPVQQAPVQPQAVSSTPQVQQVPVQQPVTPQVAPVTQPVQPQVQAQPQVAQQPVQPQQQPTTINAGTEMNSQTVQPTPQNTVPVNPEFSQPAPVADLSSAQNINPQAPINPIQNTPVSPTPGVLGPSIPINPGEDVTGIGFVPASSEIPKKKNKPLIIGIIVAVIAALGLLGYFVIYPLIMRIFFSNPMNVYQTSINTFYKGIASTTNQVLHTKAIYDIDLTFDSNIEQFSNFSGYTYGVNFGVDPDKELLQMGFNLKNNENDNEYSFYDYLKDGKEYLKYSNNRGYIYAGEVDLEETSKLFATYKDLFDTTNNLDSTDVEYLINKLRDLTIGSINEDKLSKEDTTLNINEQTIKVTNNKYEMDRDTIKNMNNYIINGLKDDSKSLELLSNYFDLEKDETKELLENMTKDSKDDNDDEDLVVTVNIYTYGHKSEIIGFGITTSDQSIELQYYNKDNYFELNGKTSYDNKETGKLEENTLAVVGKTENNKTNVSVKVNDSEVLTLVITSWTDTKQEFSYNLKYDEYKYNGKFVAEYDINDDRIKNKISFDINSSDEYIKVVLNFTEDWTSDVSNINTDNAVTMTDEELETKRIEFYNSLIDTPIGSLFKTAGGDMSDDVLDYYNNSYNNEYNYNAPTEEVNLDSTNEI